MSMIQATALENGGVAQNQDAYSGSRLAHQRWHVHPLIPCIAGLIVVAAAGGVAFVSEGGQAPATTAQADNALEERLHVAGSATTTHELVESPVRAAVPDGLGAANVERMRPAEDGAGAATGAAAAASSDARPSATAVAAHPIESLHPGAKARDDGPAVAQAAEARLTEPIAPIAASTSEQALSADASSSLPSAIETGSIGRDNDPAAPRIARIVSDVRMRAGPSNGDAVLAMISRGRPVEVIDCRAWCEVVFAGQRGWVYKGFIGALPIRDER